MIKEYSFLLESELPVKKVIEQLTALLASEHISSEVDGSTIRSKEIPLPFLSFDRSLHTRKNWTGVNPFIVITKISFFLKELNLGQTQVDVTIDQKRAIILYVFYISLVFLVLIKAALSSDFPLKILILLAIIIPILVRLFIFDLCIKKLIKSEIVKALK
jgi:hypothetical protein